MKQEELWPKEPRSLVPNADVCTSRHHGAETSREAFDSTHESTRQRQRDMVLELIKRKGKEGATCEEASALLGIPYTAASARISQLAALKLIHRLPKEIPGSRRRTKHGKAAAVNFAGPGEESAR